MSDLHPVDNPAPSALRPLPGARTALRIAHRGASGLYPENTMLAFRRAVEIGVDYLEVDVHLTRDGELVVIHDETLERTTNGTGLVHDHTLAQMQALDAGQGEHVPLLQEVFELARHNDTRLCLEVKGIDPHAALDITAALVEAVQAAHLTPRVVVTSFIPAALRRAKDLEPALATLLDPWPQDGTLSPRAICEQTLQARANIISYDFEYVTPQVVREAQLTGLALWPWAPNTHAEIRALLELGVDGIMTDRPDVLNEVLNAAAV
jgi:glycerophosphoryl diester phosphodiesterase